jgi:hypothetical protein
MLLIYGNRTGRIKKYTDNGQYCPNCKSFDLDIKVFRRYFHFFFIPFFPTSAKTSAIKCNSCGRPVRSDSIQTEYEKRTRTPFYLYSGSILFGSLVLLIVIANQYTQKEKARFVDQPKVGDVYLIRNEENGARVYYFLRLSEIKGDTVYAYHSNLQYSQFISKLSYEDFFVKDEELVFTKKELKDMLDKAEINSVERDYGNEEGFNRIR